MSGSARNQGLSRLPGREQIGKESNPTITSKQNYSAVKYGTDKGSIKFGHIHKKADVTAGVMLDTPDGRHSLFLDVDGQRKGWTSSISPGNFQVLAGEDNTEPQDTLILNAVNGNICITAANGKIRLQGTDIELIAVGEGGAKGNIRLDATENISTNSKSFKINSVNSLSFNSPSNMEIAANGVLTLYGSVIRGVTDACAVKDSKNGNKRKQKKFNK